MFCPKCGSMMFPKGEIWVCRKCGNTLPIKEDEKKGIVEKGKKKETIVVEKEEINLPIDKTVQCPKCNEFGVYWEALQTRAADEPETRFYTCTHCGHRWREY
ncbi:MAG: transcription factor S [Thermoplasmatales archaeon]|nr:transcription factor S [Thermoplasmatales archaeon]